MKQKVIILPEDWKIDKVEDNKIILKENKEELPNTYEECYKKLNVGEFITNNCSIASGSLLNPDKHNYNAIPIGLGKPMIAFMRLLICREVYRQGWKPNWNDIDSKFIIQYRGNNITTGITMFSHTVLSFQSVEVRDKFLENFRDLINEAKEFI